MTTATRRRLTGPPGFPVDWYLTRLKHGGMRSAEFRRETCRTNPLLFGLVYLAHHLESAETGGLVSLSEFHVNSAKAALVWMRTDLGPAEVRRGWVTSRGGGKSTWWNLILLLWAMAYDHRDFIVVFGHTSAMARRHLLSLRSELAKNERLRSDFPELCSPAKHGRRSVMDTQDGYMAESGACIIVAGLDQGTLGIKVENRRPSLIVIDDGEPADGLYSDYQRDQRLSILREAVLFLSVNAAVELVGTTTRLGSIMDQVLKGAPWAKEENFVAHHYPALITDEDGSERSSWPDRWPLEYLQGIRHTRSFQINMQCQPVSAEGTHWKPEDFVYDHNGWISRNVEVKVLACDPAVTSKATSDRTGMSVVGYAPALDQVLIERATGVRLDPKSLREMVHKTLRADPTIRHVICEVTQGGDWVLDTLRPLPGGVKLVETRPTGSKLSRITAMFDLYQRGKIVHARNLPQLEAEQCAFPGANDDIIDSAETGARWLREKYGVKG